MILLPPISTRTDTLVPDTTLFLSAGAAAVPGLAVAVVLARAVAVEAAGRAGPALRPDRQSDRPCRLFADQRQAAALPAAADAGPDADGRSRPDCRMERDRKSTRLNSSH